MMVVTPGLRFAHGSFFVLRYNAGRCVRIDKQAK